MSRVKIMTDEDLTKNIEDAIAAYEILQDIYTRALTQTRIGGDTFRDIAKAGKATAQLKRHLISKYEDRVNSIDATRERFGDGCYEECSFN